MLISLLDNDQYVFTMQQAFLKLGFGAIPAEFTFKCRTPDVDLLPAMNELNDGINSMYGLRLTPDELDYMRSIRYFSDEYLSFLKTFRFDPEYVNVDYSLDDGLKVPRIKIRGPLFYVMPFEVPLLSTISQAYGTLHEGNEQSAVQILEDKLQGMPEGFKFADFGTRRRRSFDWHGKVIEKCKEFCPDEFAGTSNMYYAMHHGLKAIGTHAHLWFQAHQQLGYRLIDSQKMALENWVKVYRGDLGIALSDTINTDAFLRDFDDSYFVKLFDGVREDSEEDPIKFGHRIANFYLSKGINPREKTVVFSNSLNFPKAYKIYEELHNIINVSFGIGTNLTNDWGLPTLNIVIKMTRCNGQPVAKISNAPGKGMCEDEEFVSYLKSVFRV